MRSVCASITFDGHLAEPASAHDLGEAERVVCIGLVDLHAQCGLGVTGIEADDGQLALAQRAGQEIRQQAGLQADANHGGRVRPDGSGNGVRIGRTGASPDACACIIDAADGGQVLRDVQTDVVTLFHSKASELACCTRRISIPDAGRRRDYAMSRPTFQSAPRPAAIK